MEWIRSVGYLHVPVPKCPRKWRWGGRRGSLSIENNHLGEDPAGLSPQDGLQNKRGEKKKCKEEKKQKTSLWIFSLHEEEPASSPITGNSLPEKKKKSNSETRPYIRWFAMALWTRGKKKKRKKKTFHLLSCTREGHLAVPWVIDRRGVEPERRTSCQSSVMSGCFLPHVLLLYHQSPWHACKQEPSYLFIFLFVLVYLKRGKINDKNKVVKGKNIYSYLKIFNYFPWL